jgi:hypothetical protein
MANVFIDPAVVQRLISTQLQTGLNSTVPVRIIGEGEPNSQSMVARLQSITLTPAKRRTQDDQCELAALEFLVTVTLGESQMVASSYAVGAAVAALYQAMAYQTLRDTDSTHEVHIDHGSMVIGERSSEQPLTEVGSVTFTGRVKRQTGATLADHLA